MIPDYPALIARVTERTGQADIAPHAAEYVGMAEEYIRTALRIGVVDLIADIDGLETAGTNWLLAESPEIYVLAVCYQAYQAANDLEAGGVTKSLLDEALDKMHHDAKLAAVHGVEIDWGGVLK